MAPPKKLPPNDESAKDRTERCLRLSERLEPDCGEGGSAKPVQLFLDEPDRAMLLWLCQLIIKWDQEDQDLIAKLKRRVSGMDLPEVTRMMGSLALSKLRLASDMTQWKGIFAEVARYIVVKPKAVEDEGPTAEDMLAHAGVTSVRPQAPK